MNKLKSINFNRMLKIFKCSLIGIVVTLIGTVVLAFVLKFANFSYGLIAHINNFIKLVSLFIAIECIRRGVEGKFIINSILIGIVYAILGFVVFSIFNGGLTFDVSLVYDLLFSVVSSVILSIVINLIGKK